MIRKLMQEKQNRDVLAAAIASSFLFALTMALPQAAFAKLTQAQRNEIREDNKKIAQERKELKQAQKEFKKDARAVASGKKTAEQVGLADSARAIQQARGELQAAKQEKKHDLFVIKETNKSPQQKVTQQDNKIIKQEKKDLAAARKEFNKDVKAVVSGKKTAEQVGLVDSARALEQARRDLKAAQDTKKSHQGEIRQANKKQQEEIKVANQKIVQEQKKLNGALKEFKKDVAAVNSGKQTAEGAGLAASAKAVEDLIASIKALKSAKRQDIASFKRDGGLSSATLASIASQQRVASNRVAQLEAQLAQALAFNKSMAAEYQAALDKSKLELASANARLTTSMSNLEQQAVALTQTPVPSVVSVGVVGAYSESTYSGGVGAQGVISPLGSSQGIGSVSTLASSSAR